MNKDTFIKFLSAFELSRHKISKILEEMGGEYEFQRFYLSDAVEKILGNNYTEIAHKSNQKYFDAYLNRLEEKGIGLITIEDERYPERLKQLDDPPFYLYYKGDITLINQKSVSIVGTRSPSSYGIVVTERFASQLAEAGAVIVSGLAYGVDSIAHRKALDVQGKTIAVLAGGFDNIYPPQHLSLFEEIAQKGLVLTEHRPDIKNQKYYFVERNRIVAALGESLLITEAGAQSGTFITKDFAMDLGRPIYAVPGNITSHKSDGTNTLLISGQCNFALDPLLLIEELGLKKIMSQKNSNFESDEEKIVELLQDGAKDIETISQNINFPFAKLASLLTTMEINGIIKKLPGNFYALN